MRTYLEEMRNMPDFDFNWKFKDFEVRTTRSLNRGSPYLELVKWSEHEGRRSCYTLAYWHRDKDGCWELHFVCDRPLEVIAEEDVSPIWKQLFLAQAMFEDAERQSGEDEW